MEVDVNQISTKTPFQILISAMKNRPTVVRKGMSKWRSEEQVGVTQLKSCLRGVGGEEGGCTEHCKHKAA